MKLTYTLRAQLKAKAYVLDIVSGLVPGDPEFEDIWELLPDFDRMMALPPCDDFIDLAKKIMAVRNEHANRQADTREG